MAMSLHALMLLGIAIPACLLFAGSVILLSKRRSLPSWLQLIGSAGLMMVVLTHFAEAFDLIPWMHWGAEDSAGHYLDLGSALMGLTLFPIGYLAHALAR
jgi:hypothetical protein